ncbi:MAG: glycoside hydrolase family 3 C-terminal domain-containing protein [Lachnospiraceae bacterium]|nr:glycoside hydrolase family 3 C-terminal domain-containing protein [Butyrivibrio sp.]MCM1342713.1 glycoside hydrolase family 3 C-terminal domain-containing protein [Muribaculaceae bacterium]MCM1410023.1 glycoside hydrolase family 3 C-terminal domain-containing protein [Lachnospiraceae bacterium]
MQKWARALYQPMLPMGKDGKRITASEEHILLSKEAAKEGMVLLKNEDSLLPLAKGSRVALFGKASFDYVKGGGGSGDVTVSYTRNLYQGLKEKSDHVTVFEELSAFYRENVEAQYAAGSVPGLTVEPEVPEALLKKARAFTDTAIITISRFSGEGWDRSVQSSGQKLVHVEDSNLYETAEKIYERGDFYLSRREEAMADMVKKAFPKVILVINAGGVVDSSWFAEDPAIRSVLMTWQGGMEGGLAAAELLVGEGSPCGKLADTFAKSLEDYPSSDNFHESEDHVDYTDDIYVGYRYFETIPKAAGRVNYPFGFGLSYTRFSLGKPSAEQKENHIEITVSVCNIGDVPGKEVVQVYYSAPQGRLGKPARELIAFRKSRLLAPGETQTMVLCVPFHAMASYDDLGKVARAAYIMEQGSYHLYVGTSVRDVVADFVMELPQSVIVKQLANRLTPTSLKKRMCADGSYEELPMGEPFQTDASILEPLPLEKTNGLAPAVKPRSRYKMWGEEKKVHTLDEVAEGNITLKEFLAQLSHEQLADLLGGQPNTGVADVFGYGNLPEYGVPDVMTADGPAGLRIRPDRGVCATAWPCATLLACTWNPELVERVGAAGGAEIKENNIAVWLAPAVNIHRSPLCGRNFEYYSEDPFLTGKLAAAMVRGIQSNHVGAAVKHFALNNKETNRKNSDSRASERAIREIYLSAFEIVVREADPWCIMSSYNIINGRRASESRELLEDILRGEWGFKGMVTTDWWTAGEHYKEVKAGNDAKMGCGFPERLLEALRKGVLSRQEMEICAGRILEMILKLD